MKLENPLTKWRLIISCQKRILPSFLSCIFDSSTTNSRPHYSTVWVHCTLHVLSIFLNEIVTEKDTSYIISYLCAEFLCKLRVQNFQNRYLVLKFYLPLPVITLFYAPAGANNISFDNNISF
jgi:hypothetical protein